ncbi:hypothetical protein DPMN_083481 [Dreissena polymorpha]|uniref:Uncharacterized protein n=1 Tax=Dreissena polymorpha TaxID=45954 RepID=A0A9D3YCQ8_DREPO|nr:hypothetical protein DPMN_083481 [Dreissena polymorpha]
MIFEELVFDLCPQRLLTDLDLNTEEKTMTLCEAVRKTESVVKDSFIATVALGRDSARLRDASVLRP